LARRIRWDVKRAGWPVGRNMGSEDDLLQRYGAGRTSLREAIRILEHHGAAEMRRGPGGGLIVRAPSGEAVLHAATLYLEYRGIRPAGLLGARQALEMATLRLAIERLDDEGQDKLRYLLDDRNPDDGSLHDRDPGH